MVRMNESPEIETHIINSGDAIGGAGEPGTPAIAPALANAFYDAIGIRICERRSRITASGSRTWNPRT